MNQQPWCLGQAAKLLRGFEIALPAIEMVIGAALEKLPDRGRAALAIAQSARAFPEVVREASIALAKRGWYYDLEIPTGDFLDIHAWIADGNWDAVTSHLAQHFERRAPAIEAALLDTHPARVEPLRQAFETARLGLFFVAIPTLLAQADGLSMDILGGKLFKSENKQPEAAKGLAQMPLDESTLKFLASLQQNSGFNAAERYEHEFPDSPNRHAILHGRDCEYGTRINYLKTLSLLAFVGLNVPEILGEARSESKPP